jgi:hypothetical protein
MGVMKQLDLRRIEGTIGGNNRGSAAISHMSPINNGRSVNLRLSDKAAGEMRSRKMTHVQYAWDDDGRAQWLVIEPSGSGLKVRYSNKGLRPHVHVPTVDIGKASYVAGGSLDCPEERIDGDEFAFRVPDGLRFEKGEQK